MSQGHARAGFTAVLLAAAALLVTLASGLGPGSRLVPLTVALFLAALLIVQLARDLRSGERVAVSRADRGAVGWIASLAALILLVGLVPGTAAFVSIYLRRRGGEGWPVTLAGGGAAALALWLVITRALAAPAPRGLLASLLGS